MAEVIRRTHSYIIISDTSVLGKYTWVLIQAGMPITCQAEANRSQDQPGEVIMECLRTVRMSLKTETDLDHPFAT
jgi:hypothetical protein